ncbi:MAG: ABC transporter permease [Candidatus Aenigmarchaeota archaeon]|nr:ABC transporter permease [Candidatus Aenigmarchaeota archaeon]
MIVDMVLMEFGRHKLRTLLTMLGIVIGIFLVTSVQSISEGVTYYVNDQIAITSGLVTVIESGGGYNVQSSEIDYSLMGELESIGGVDKVAVVKFMSFDDIGRVTGTTPESEDILKGVNIGIEEGRGAIEGAYEVEVGYSYAKNNGITLGDTLKINGSDFEVVGIMQESGDSDLDGSVIMFLDVMQELTGDYDTVSLFMIKPVSPADADFIEQTINEEYDDIQAATDKSIQESVGEMLSQLNIMTFALGGIASLISAIVIMNVMIMSVRERRRMIGTIKAIGGTDRQVISMILLEAVALSVMGAAIGVVLSFGGAAFINSFMPRPMAIITPRLIAIGFLLAISIGVISGITPARQAAKMDPIEALRYE